MTTGTDHVPHWLADHRIEVVDCVFPDRWGALRGRRVPVTAFSRVLADGIGAPLAPYLLGRGGDLLPRPGARAEDGFPNLRQRADPDSLRDLGNGRAICFLDTVDADGSGDSDDPRDRPHQQDTRGQLRRSVQLLAERGQRALVATELEFYLCRADGSPLQPHRAPFSVGLAEEAEAVLAPVREQLLRAGIEVISTQTESGPGQFELNLAPADPMTMADSAALLRHLLRSQARRHGLLASFMPVPYTDELGSGQHVHLSLWDDAGTNLFDPGTVDGPTPELGRHLNGLLARLAELSALLLPSVNAYHRMGDGSFAPNRICWGHDNRSAALRLPAETGAGSRIEVRTASSDANAHLVLAAILAAGATGSSDTGVPPHLVEGDAYARDDLPRMPGSLAAAAALLRASVWARDTFGADFVDGHADLCRQEHELWQRQVGEWERSRYLDVD